MRRAHFLSKILSLSRVLVEWQSWILWDLGPSSGQRGGFWARGCFAGSLGGCVAREHWDCCRKYPPRIAVSGLRANSDHLFFSQRHRKVCPNTRPTTPMTPTVPALWAEKYVPKNTRHRSQIRWLIPDDPTQKAFLKFAGFASVEICSFRFFSASQILWF